MDLAQLQVVIRAELAPFERDLGRARQAIDRFDRASSRGFNQANRSLGLLSTQMGGTLTIMRRMQAALGLLMGGFAGNAIIQMTNAWTDLNSRVNIAVGSQEKGAAVMARLDSIARRTYSSMQLTVESFLNASSSLRQLGYSTQTQLDYTEALNNALVVSGAKGDRAASVMNALGKAFAFGQLRGDELNTVLKVGGRVAEALAKGLGVTTNDLRKLGQEGQLTTDKVIKALLSQLELLREEADSMPATVGDAFTLMGNAVLKFVGTAATASGTTSTLANVVIHLADRIKGLSVDVPKATGHLQSLNNMGSTFSKTADSINSAIEFMGRFLLFAVDNAGLLIRVFAIFIGMKVASSFVSLVTILGKAAAAMRLFAIATAAYSLLARRSVLITGGLIALIAKFTGQTENLQNMIAESFAAVQELLPEGMPTVANDYLKSLGLNVEAFSLDLSDLTVASDDASGAIDSLDNVLARNNGTMTKAEKAYRNLTKAAEDRIATLKNELMLVGMAPIAAERLRFQQEMLNDATDQGRTISAGQRKEIAALAETYASLTSQLAVARIAQDVLLARTQMFGTMMQRITADLRAQGVDIESAQGKWLAGQIALNERLGMARDLTGDFARTLMQDLQQGANLFDALTNAVGRLRDRLLDMALDAALNRLFSVLAGSLGGRSLSPAAGALTGAGLFASGGYTGHGPRMAPAGIVHRGEFVVNAPQTRRFRPLLESINARGYATGGIVGMSGARGLMGPQVKVEVIDQRQRGAPVGVSEARGPNGERVIRALVRDEVANFSKTSAGQSVGLKPRMTRQGLP